VKQRASLIVKVAISGALLTWMATSVDLQVVSKSVAQLRASSIALAVSLILLQSLLLGLRWYRIIGWLGGRLSLGQSIRWVFIGLFFNQALPSSVGGDAVRIWALHRQGADPGVAFGSVVIERGTGVAMLGLMITGCVLMIWPLLGKALALPLLLTGPLLLALLVVLALLDRVIGALLPPRLAKAVVGMGAGLRQIARSPRALFEVAGLGLVASFAGLLAANVLGSDLGIHVGLAAYVALVGGAVLLSVLPVSLGGWGLREASMVAMFGALGTAPEPVVAMSVIWGLLPLVISLPFGLMWWLGQDRQRTADKPLD